MVGLVGTHVEANSPHYSRDKAIEAIKRIGGKYATIVNDPQLCMMCLDIGVTPIYRINRQGFMDDNAHQHFKASDYIAQANMEVPDKRVLIYLNNEPGQADIPLLNSFMIEGAKTAHDLDRVLAGYNWAYRNLNSNHYPQLKPSYDIFNYYDFFIGHHEGYDTEYSDLTKAKGEAIGRFIPYLQKGLIKHSIITEFAASKDAYNGWSTWLNPTQWSSLVEDAIQQVYSPYNIAITPFTLFEWHNGFDYINSIELQNNFTNINNVYQAKDITMPIPALGKSQLTKSPQGSVNIRSTYSTDGSILGQLTNGDIVMILELDPSNNWVHVSPSDSNKAMGWVSLQNGAVQFTLYTNNIFTDSEIVILKQAISIIENKIS